MILPKILSYNIISYNTAYLREAICVKWIDGKKAGEIAMNFLQQHYSVVNVEKPILKETFWEVVVTVSSPVHKIFAVKIDVKTGKISGY